MEKKSGINLGRESLINDVIEIYNPEKMQMFPVRFQFISKTYWGWIAGCAIGAAAFKNNGITPSNQCIDFCVNHYNLPLQYIRGVIDGFDDVLIFDKNTSYLQGYADGSKLYKMHENIILLGSSTAFFKKPQRAKSDESSEIC